LLQKLDRKIPTIQNPSSHPKKYKQKTYNGVPRYFSSSQQTKNNTNDTIKKEEKKTRKSHAKPPIQFAIKKPFIYHSEHLFSRQAIHEQKN
jgi:hypothetical protein